MLPKRTAIFSSYPKWSKNRALKLVCISDTHGEHRKLQLPKGDLLIHAGDISNGYQDEVEDFLLWFDQLPFTHKVFIGGNMDFPLAQHPTSILGKLSDNVHYLQDELVEIEGLRIWGSPWIPEFVGVFMKKRGADIDRYWEKIPANLDVLITHTPPYGILDTTSRGVKVGCANLAQRLEELAPRFHIFGHVHEAYGYERSSSTQFVNVAFLNRMGYNSPVEITV